MRDFTTVYNLPNVPAVYAFYSGDRGPKYVAYVGITGRLKRRIVQHVITGLAVLFCNLFNNIGFCEGHR